MKRIILLITATLLLGSMIFAGCTTANASSTGSSVTTETAIQTTDTQSTTSSSESSSTSTSSSQTTTVAASVEGSFLNTDDIFTERDLEQTADFDEAQYIGLVSGQDVTITDEGVYVISGDVQDTTIIVDSDDEAKIQLVLDGVSIVNSDAPAIYVKSADKVFVTTTDTENYMEVSGTYEADGDVNLDAVIFSKDDLVLNGVGTLEVISAQGNGITSKDDLKITGGTYYITSLEDGLEANDSISIAGGDITVDTNKDALHSEDDEDQTVGYIYIVGGSLDITAADDGIRATTVFQIDGGTINIQTSMEGIEATSIQINGGDITIYAKDDGINASAKSNLDLIIEINGGTLDVTVGSGDTDAIDSNGSIYVNDGVINISANSSFDSNGTAQLNGGTVYVNGQLVTQIVGGMGGMGGGTKSGGRGGRP